MQAKTAVVTGAEGFIGSSLVRELRNADWSVVALHRPGADLGRLSGVSAELRSCDITKVEDLTAAVPEGARALFHLAADRRISRSRAVRQREINVDGTRNVLEVALAKGVGRLLYTSSMGAFGLHQKRIDETAVSNALATPVNYFRTKYLGELEVDRAILRGLDAVIVNPANVMGPRNTENLTAAFIRLVHAGSMPAVGPGCASFCHVREVARAMIACVERGSTGERHLLGGADASFLELAEAIVREAGGRPPRVVPGWVFRALTAGTSMVASYGGLHTVLTREVGVIVTSRMLVDSGKAISELSYSPVPLDKLVRDEAGWLREHGVLETRARLLWR